MTRSITAKARSRKHMAPHNETNLEARWSADLAVMKQSGPLRTALEKVEAELPGPPLDRRVLDCLADEALADVQAMHGFGPDGEPTKLGLLIEDAIDLVNSYRFELDSIAGSQRSLGADP